MRVTKPEAFARKQGATINFVGQSLMLLAFEEEGTPMCSHVRVLVTGKTVSDRRIRLTTGWI